VISRRLLLASTAAVAVSRILPLPNRVGDIGGPSTWGAGTAGLDLAMGRSITAWAMVRNGIMTVAEVRAAEDLPPFDFKALLR
jgi:hypothetical protein